MQIERVDSAPAHMRGFASMTDYEIHQACRKAQAQGEMEGAFLQACRKADANALVDWAPMTTDWQAVKGIGAMPVSLAQRDDLPKRMPTLTEVMTESLDFTKGPCMSELMQLLCNVAYGSDVVNAPEQARKLIRRMAQAYAEVHA